MSEPWRIAKHNPTWQDYQETQIPKSSNLVIADDSQICINLSHWNTGGVFEK